MKDEGWKMKNEGGMWQPLVTVHARVKYCIVNDIIIVS